MRMPTASPTRSPEPYIKAAASHSSPSSRASSCCTSDADNTTGSRSGFLARVRLSS